MEHLVVRRESASRLSVEKPTGSRSFINGDAFCLYRKAVDQHVQYIVESGSSRPALIAIGEDDTESMAVLDSLPTRSAPDLVDQVLSAYEPPKPLVAVEGRLYVDGTVLTLVVGARRHDFVVGADVMPATGRVEQTDAGLEVDVDVAAGERVRLAIAPDGVDDARRALAVIRAETAKAAETSTATGRHAERWQYKVVKNMTANKLEETLNGLGRSGWELVSMTGLDGVVSLTGNKLYAVMKRRL